jgi:DNA primase
VNKATRSLVRGVLLATVVAVGASGCAPIEPWVKPYEREHLADPIMAIDPDPVSSSYMDHVFEVREAAKGAMGGAGGGCGCS